MEENEQLKKEDIKLRAQLETRLDTKFQEKYRNNKLTLNENKKMENRKSKCEGPGDTVITDCGGAICSCPHCYDVHLIKCGDIDC